MGPSLTCPSQGRSLLGPYDNVTAHSTAAHTAAAHSTVLLTLSQHTAQGFSHCHSTQHCAPQVGLVGPAQGVLTVQQVRHQPLQGKVRFGASLQGCACCAIVHLGLFTHSFEAVSCLAACSGCWLC